MEQVQQILNDPKGTALHLGDFGTTPLHLAACVDVRSAGACSTGGGAEDELPAAAAIASASTSTSAVASAAAVGRETTDAANCARVLLSKQGQEFFHVDSLDNGNKTPLDFAASAGNVVVAKVLLEHGAPVNLRDNRNKTALHFAAGRGHKEVCGFLLLHALCFVFFSLTLYL
jgi:Ankyrin repeats (3 copies)